MTEEHAIFSEFPIPGMTCDWQPNGEGGGIWICRPKPITHEEIADKAFENYKAKFPSEPIIPDMLTMQFWLDAQSELEEEHHHHHHHHEPGE